MNIQTSVVTSPLNWRLYAWAVSVCVHRLAQSGFLHAAAHCSHNNRACSHRQFIVAPNNSVQEKQDATPVDEKSTTLRHALKKLDHYRTLSVANSVAYRCMRHAHGQLRHSYMICVWKYPVAVALWIQCEWTKWLKRVSLPKFNTVLCNVTGRQEFMPRSMMEKTNKQKLLLLLPG